MLSNKVAHSSVDNPDASSIFDPHLRESEQFKSLCDLIRSEGLQGFYDNLSRLAIGKDIFLSIEDLLYLASLDKSLQDQLDVLHTKSGDISASKQNHELRPTYQYQKHPIVKEKNGEGMNYVMDTTFQSWEGTITDDPGIIFIPQTIIGLQNLVNWAKKENKKIRCSAYRHSSSDVFVDDQQVLLAMVDLNTATTLPAQYPHMDPNNDMQRIQLIGDPYEKDGKTKVKCKIGAATCNYHILDWAHDAYEGNWAWTLPLNVIMSEISFAGSNATMCHGAGINNKTLSDLVTEMEFVNVKGELQTISDKEQLKAAAGCFGLLGIVTSITVELDEMTYANLKTNEKKLITLTIPPPNSTVSQQLKDNLSKENILALSDPSRLAEARLDFIKQCENSYYAEWFWFPLQDRGWVNCWNNDGDKNKAIRYPDVITTDMQRAGSYLAYLGTNAIDDNICTPLLRKIQTKIVGDLAMSMLPDKPNIVCSMEDALHFRKGIQNFRARMMEIEIPVPDLSDSNKPDWSVCQEAWWAVIESIYSKENLIYFPMRTTLEMRVMGGSDVMMAAQSKNKRTCSIEVLTPVSNNPERWDKFLQEVLDKWAALKNDKGEYLNIRPHWAKRFDQLFINRDKSWMNEWDEEQKLKLGKYIKSDSQIISIPMREYLKTIAYKNQINDFIVQLSSICKQGGYDIQDIKDRFSNAFLDDLFYKNLSLQLGIQKNHSFFKLKETIGAPEKDIMNEKDFEVRNHL